MKSRLHNIYRTLILTALLALTLLPALRLAAESVITPDYTLVHTKGIIDEKARELLNKLNKERKVRYYEEWCDWSNWTEEGEWKTDDDLKTPGITMPISSYVTANDDWRIKDTDGIRQRTHVQEHVAYHILDSDHKGIESRTYLYPYSDYGFSTSITYCDSLNRWYDYTLDKASDNLHFNDIKYWDSGVVDDKYAWYSGGVETEFGHLGGPQAPNDFHVDVEIKSIQDYLKFVNEVNSGKTNLNAVLLCDLDFAGITDVMPIGRPDNENKYAYVGTFDGRGHTIKNLNIHPKKTSEHDSAYDKGSLDFSGKTLDWTFDNSFYGMFGCVGGGCKIMSLHIDKSCTFRGRQFVGVVGGTYNNLNGTVKISNISMEGSIEASTNAAGIYGSRYQSLQIEIRDCLMAGSIYKLDKTEYISSNVGAFISWAGNASGDWIGSRVYNSLNMNLNLTPYGAGTVLMENTFTLKKGKKVITDTDGNQTEEEYLYIENEKGETRRDFGSKTFAKQLNSNNLINWGYNEPDLCPTPFREFHSHLPGQVAQFAFAESDPTETDQETGKTYYKDKIIALDISQTFDNIYNIDHQNKKIIEPIIAFRHIFTIEDGRKFADKHTSSPSANKAYINETRRKVSGRANDDFLILLDYPMPTVMPESDDHKDQTDNPSKSSRYYLKGDNQYAQFTRCFIKTTKIMDGNGLVPLDGVSEIFTEAEGSVHRTPDGRFTNMIECKAENAAPGAYLVQIYAADSNDFKVTENDIIKIYNTNEKLQVAEYIVTFMNDEEASMKNEDNIPEEHAQDNLEKKHGKPLAQINFDEYSWLETHTTKEDGSSDYFETAGPIYNEDALQANYAGEKNLTPYAQRYRDKNGNEQTLTARYFKWPRPWDSSSYGFGYGDRMEYSMYMLTNHSQSTPYHNATSAKIYGAKPVVKDEEAEGDADEPQKQDVEYGYFVDREYRVRHDQWLSVDGRSSDGLFDRRYYDNIANCPNGELPLMGYFYYVNAAADPGEICQLDLNSNLCPGTILHVSAWMAEFSLAEERANVIFKFQAVMKGEKKTRKTLHSFVSGQVPEDEIGNWMHVYYSFVFNSAEVGDINNVDHYELVLENNARSSHGADYAIDDIRIYASHPNVMAQQTDVYCNESYSSKVKVGIDFETLLATMGVTMGQARKDQVLELYYTFIDKAKYSIKDHGAPIDKAFLSYDYNGNGVIDKVMVYDIENENGDVTKKQANEFFGKFNFHTHYSNNTGNDENGIKSPDWLYAEKLEGRDFVWFNAEPNDKDMHVGKEYLIAMYLPNAEWNGNEFVTDVPDIIDYTDFDVDGECAKIGLFVVQPAATILINGVAEASMNDIYCCPNQTPKISVSLLDPTNPENKVEGVFMDWYLGNMEDYLKEEITEGDVGISLTDALSRLHIIYPDFTGDDWEGIAPARLNDDSDILLTEGMISYIRNLCDPANGQKLILTKEEFIFSHTNAYEDANMVIIPVDAKIEADFQICANPIQVTIHYHQPEINHGFNSMDKAYPMDDVPIRLGLSQIEKVSVGKNTNNIDSHASLMIPLRGVKPVTDGYNKLNKTIDIDPQIMLVSTTDPMFMPKTGEELPFIGEVLDMTATHTIGNASNDDGNNMNIVFYDDAVVNGKTFRFREGYEYKLRFGFIEYKPQTNPDTENTEDTDNVSDPEPCGGFHDFTIKVVAKYQKWTGQGNPNVNNWNNDNNWRRVSSSELFINTIDETNGKYVTDSENNQTTSFAPLMFTNVIIPGLEYSDSDNARTTSVPDLYAAESSRLPFTEGNYIWWHPDPEYVGSEWHSKVNDSDDETKHVQYDLVATAKSAEEGTGYKCVPWYMNTCEQIHFKPDSEIGNQRFLNYEKAWVDVELEHDKWYTLASPLQEVIAGDWYAPSNNARQESELFKGIYFGKEEENGVLVQKSNLNHRFKPAVYQRAWNKATTKIYEFGKDNVYDDNEEWVFENGIDQIVKNEWSHVYNDVTVDNGQAGIGFSIKADATETEVWDAMSDEQKKGYKTLFRLPKDDENYLYYQHGFGDNSAEDTGSGHYTPIGVREQRNKLQQYEVGSETKIITTVTGAAMEDSKAPEYFLVGNPFMAHLDMKTFLEKNSEVIEQKYWILDGKSQKAAVMTGHGLITSDENWQGDYIAPMQGFFVQKKKASSEGTQERTDENTLTVVFDEKWTAVNLDLDMPSRLKAKTRGGDADALRISAIADGVEESQTLLMIEDEADAAFRSGEDVEMFDDDTQRDAARVFTFAGNMASLINRMPELTMTELALLAPEGKDVTLRFDGVDALGEVYLYDAREHSLTSIFDGMEYVVSGNVKSRLYITSGIELTDMTDAISISAVGNEVTVIAPDNSEGLAVTVSDMGARLVFNERTPDNGMSFSLPRGIYAVRAVSGDIVKTEKIMIR